MKPLWHNCYIDDKKFLKVKFKKLELYKTKIYSLLIIFFKSY